MKCCRCKKEMLQVQEGLCEMLQVQEGNVAGARRLHFNAQRYVHVEGEYL